MGTKIGDLANSYHTAFNNQLNAQKAYINSYLDGINARNAVNQEARTQDQYYNYTQPLQSSNLSVILPQNQTQADFYGDPNVRRQQLAIANQVLGNQYGMSQTEGSLLPTYQRILTNNVGTSDQNALYNLAQSKANRAMQADNNATAAYNAKVSLGQAQGINNLRAAQIQQQLDAINNPNQTGTENTPASGLTPINNSDGSWGKAENARLSAAAASQGKALFTQDNAQNSQAILNSNPFLSTNYSADQLQSALSNLTSSTDSILGSTPDMFLSPENRARKAAFNSNYELIKQARDIKLAEQKAQKQIESQAYLKRLTDEALAKQRIKSGLK